MLQSNPVITRISVSSSDSYHQNTNILILQYIKRSELEILVTRTFLLFLYSHFHHASADTVLLLSRLNVRHDSTG